MNENSDAGTVAPTHQLTMDEARSLAAASIAGIISATLEKVKDEPAETPVDAANKERVLAAYGELRASLVKHSRDFSRPRILRPSRSLKVVGRG